MTTEGISTGKKIQGQSSITSPTEERATKYSVIEVSPICLPKGDGALNRIHERFEVNVASGTANLNVPVPVTAGCHSFTRLLAYGSRSVGWNRSLEIGWSFNYPTKQKENKHLPDCREESDERVFAFSGPEDLLPQRTGEWVIKEHYS